ncbi:MAG: hypothetical protein IPM98_12985 [Lewinellaceae bacterium]|nr:hypothetical protein [Lewinellaceae bacterium]
MPGRKIAAANGNAAIAHRHGGHIPDSELQAWANARLLKDRLSRTSGRVLFQGYNTVKPGQIVVLHGFGRRFDGPVFVAAVHQEYLESGWVTEVEFGLSPKWFAEIVGTEAPRAAGMLPAVSGLQIGLVSQIEDDPDGLHRVRVRLPILDAEAGGVWARVAAFDAGANRGAFFRPEVDDEVIVGFIHDDPRDAVVLGMLHSRDKAAPFAANRENAEKGYISREGIRIVLNEKDGAITLETPGGNKLILSDSGKGMLLADQHGNQIELGEHGISIKSKKDIILESQGDCKTGSANWTVESSASAKIQSGGTLDLKGGLININ